MDARTDAMLPAALALAPVHIRLERVGRQLYRCARRQKPRPVEVAAENVELAGGAEQRGAVGRQAAERIQHRAGRAIFPDALGKVIAQDRMRADFEAQLATSERLFA